MHSAYQVLLMALAIKMLYTFQLSASNIGKNDNPKYAFSLSASLHNELRENLPTSICFVSQLLNYYRENFKGASLFFAKQTSFWNEIRSRMV